MATTAFNAYCFECLSASFDKRKPLSLSAVIDIWADYEALADDDEPVAAHNAPDDVQAHSQGQPTAPYRPAAIRRILAPNTSSSSSSSSAPSASSSTPSLNTNLSSVPSQDSSKSTSNTSLLSLPARLTKAVQTPSQYPLFVTWDSRTRSGHKNLRGCIGTFEAQELEYGLSSYALTS
jgi:AMME syndrome candidate gene 1 protein